MGSCFSKKKPPASCSPPGLNKPTIQIVLNQLEKDPHNPKKDSPTVEVVKKQEECERKEIFVIQQPKQSSPVSPVPGEVSNSLSSGSGSSKGLIVKTSSCSKEEVEAILLQCGRLSRTPSENDAASSRKYSGSKRSFDFDNESGEANTYHKFNDGHEHYRREQREQQRRSRSASSGRKRTPSRERQPRSISSERLSGCRRRVSRSPGKRSAAQKSTGEVHGMKPRNAVFIPNSLQSPVKPNESGGVRRVLVRRSGGRSRSPANGKQQLLSRSSSRKTDQSPNRRNPLGDIDSNLLVGTKYTAPPINKWRDAHPQEEMIQEPTQTESLEINPTEFEIKAIPESCVPQQSFSRRQTSRDLDFNPHKNQMEVETNSASYTALLLKDIQKFHQNNNATGGFSDLNSNGNGKMKGLEDEQSWESGVAGANDIELTDPRFHRYVTTKRGGEELEEQESSGSNSFGWCSPLENNSAGKEYSLTAEQRKLYLPTARTPAHACNKP